MLTDIRQIKIGFYIFHIQKRVVLLVLNIYIVDNQPIKELIFHVSDFKMGVEFFANFFGKNAHHSRLNLATMEQCQEQPTHHQGTDDDESHDVQYAFNRIIHAMKSILFILKIISLSTILQRYFFLFIYKNYVSQRKDTKQENTRKFSIT